MMRKKVLWILMAAVLLLASACGKKEDKQGGGITIETVERDDVKNPDTKGNDTSEEMQSGNLSDKEPAADASQRGESTGDGGDSAADAMKERFGENCIAEQTFEVELSEYEGKVYFVAFAPSTDGQDFHMQIMRDGNVLADIPAYVPDKLAGKHFSSLDAVSFYDINYDGNTDIVLIETYEDTSLVAEDTSFAAVYYGYDDGYNDMASFFPQEELSERISAQAEEVSVSGIRSFLSGGKRNGEFTDYREAYEAVMRFSALENDERQYGLIYFDEDDTPELTAGINGYNVSLYTYDAGMVYKVMDEWGYGVMGNSGYEYSPKKNSLRNYNTDYAGAILYTTYMTINAQHEMERVVEIVTYNFDDANQNGMPDEDEMGSMGNYGVSYIDEREVSPEECESYDIGGYQHMETDKDIEEVKRLLYTE